jgi:hypothetical protein
MEKKKMLEELLRALDIDCIIPNKYDDMEKMWFKLVTTKTYLDIPSEVLLLEDKILRMNMINKKIKNSEMLKTIKEEYGYEYNYSNKICLIKGDISLIYTDIIVNTLDNKKVSDLLFFKGGIRLKNKYNLSKDNDVVITRAYNLPCDMVIHTNSPNKVDEIDEFVRNILDTANNNMSKIIVIPCLEKKYHIKRLIDSIVNYLNIKGGSFSKVVLCTDSDDIYSKYLEVFAK